MADPPVTSAGAPTLSAAPAAGTAPAFHIPLSAAPKAVGFLLHTGGGRAYKTACWLGAGLLGAAMVGLVISVATGSAQAFGHYGPEFVWSGTWSPAAGEYAAGVLLAGTALTTALAVAVVAPVGLGAAVAIAELLPAKVAALFSHLISLLAAVPSIVVGLWALLVLSPIFAAQVEPALGSLPGIGWAFGGPDYGPSIILAAVVLAVMALPTMVTLSHTALSTVPAEEREAALALGATRWQVVQKIVLPRARQGIGGALTLASGRALGEAIAVAMVIGNRQALPHSLAGPGATLGSAIVNQFAEATSSLSASSVIALGAVLLVFTLAVNATGQVLRTSRRAADSADLARLAGPVASERAPSAPGVEPLPSTGVCLANARRALPRRVVGGRLMESLCALALAAAAAPVIALVGYTVARGARGLSVGFLFHPPMPVGIPGGGISTAIVGSARAVGVALLIAVPIGLLAALFIYERSGRLASALRFGADVFAGAPSIVIGIFAYTAIVRPMHRVSVLAAAFALAVLMVPVMVRVNEEAMHAVPADLQEAAAALGAERWHVVRSVVLRGSLPGLLTGNLLAVARAIGETAPLLFTVAAPTMALTLLIYSDATSAYPQDQQTAWSAALVLLAVVLVISMTARGIAWSLTRRAK